MDFRCCVRVATLIGLLLGAKYSGADTARPHVTRSSIVAEIGRPAPDFTLASSGGKSYSNASRGSQAPKATVVIFMSTRCPVSYAYNQRMVRLATAYAPRGVRFLAIDANNGESAREVAGYAQAHRFPFPVLMDVGNGVADRYNARVTPHAYLIDGSGTLRYRGRIDDSQDPSEVKSQDLRAAIDAVLAGRSVRVTETQAFGCGIRRVEKG